MATVVFQADLNLEKLPVCYSFNKKNLKNNYPSTPIPPSPKKPQTNKQINLRTMNILPAKAMRLY